jgi:hypothetical protein
MNLMAAVVFCDVCAGAEDSFYTRLRLNEWNLAVTSKRSFTKGEAMEVNIDLYNRTNGRMTAPISMPILDYGIMLIGPNGENMPLRQNIVRAINPERLISVKWNGIEGHESRVTKVLISSLFPIEKKGIYFVSICWPNDPTSPVARWPNADNQLLVPPRSVSQLKASSMFFVE